MTAPPPPTIHVYEAENLRIENIETGTSFPYIINASINERNLAEIIKYSIEGIKITLNSKPLWDEEIEIPTSISHIVNDTFKMITSLYDEGEKALSVSLADYFFNNYAVFSWKILGTSGSKNLSAKFLESLLIKVREWEERENRLVHKGTPYYFLTSLYLSMNDIDSGFASMFKAIQEDIRTKNDATGNPNQYKMSPAYKYASLVDDDQNYLYESVIKIREYLNNVISSFNTDTLYNLTIADVDQKFLNNDDFEQLKFVFTYSIEKFLKYEEQFPELLISNDFYALRNSSNIFDLCIMVDKILEKKYRSKYQISFPNRRIDLGGLIWCLFDDKGWISGISNAGELTKKINPNIFNMIPRDIYNAFVTKSITINNTPVRNEVGIMILLWGLRNWSAHHVELENIFVNNYHDLYEKLLWSFLITIETI